MLCSTFIQFCFVIFIFSGHDDDEIEAVFDKFDLDGDRILDAEELAVYQFIFFIRNHFIRMILPSREN